MPPIPTNPLHLAAAALIFPPFPNMETTELEKVGCVVALAAAVTMDDEDSDDSDDDIRLIVFNSYLV